MLLEKDAILKADDLPRETVKVPEWDGDVLVRGLTSKQRDEYMDSHMKIEATVGGKPKVTIANSEALLAVRCIISEDGNRMFSDSDANRLAQKSGAAIHRIVEVIERLSGLVDKTSEEAAKNSETPQGDDLGSG